MYHVSFSSPTCFLWPPVTCFWIQQADWVVSYKTLVKENNGCSISKPYLTNLIQTFLWTKQWKQFSVSFFFLLLSSIFCRQKQPTTHDGIVSSRFITCSVSYVINSRMIGIRPKEIANSSKRRISQSKFG